MMKNLLSFLFVIAFLFGGALAVSAEPSASPANSVAVSKRVLFAKTKANSLKTRCKSGDCSGELADLLFWNSIYEYSCAPDYLVSCSPILAGVLVGAGAVYEGCLNAHNMSMLKDTDRTMDRNKTERFRNVTLR